MSIIISAARALPILTAKIVAPTAYTVVKATQIALKTGSKKKVAMFILRRKAQKEVGQAIVERTIEVAVIKKFDEVSPTRKAATEALSALLRDGGRVLRDPRLVTRLDVNQTLREVRDLAPAIFVPFVKGRIIEDALVDRGVAPWVITGAKLIA